MFDIEVRLQTLECQARSWDHSALAIVKHRANELELGTEPRSIGWNGGLGMRSQCTRQDAVTWLKQHAWDDPRIRLRVEGLSVRGAAGGQVARA